MAGGFWCCGGGHLCFARSFRGAFGYALLRDWPLERALPFANAAAGLNCTSLGGQGGIPTLEAVERAADAA